MKIYCTTILTILIFNPFVFSQRLSKPEKLTEKHFMLKSPKYPLIIQDDNLITYPFHYNNNTTGALDKYFSLKVESFLRILVKQSDSCNLLVLPIIYENGLKIKSIKYNYLKDKKITERKVIESDISQITTEKGYFLDFSKVIQDSSVIIDIYIHAESKNKQKLLFLIDKDITYKSYSIQLYIPRIYKYNEGFDTCLSTKFEKDLRGPFIGYDNGVDNGLLSEVLAEGFSKQFGRKYKPVYCKIDYFSFTSNTICPETFDKIKELVNYSLININEITTAN